MASSRLTNWNDGDILTDTALESEFDNIYNNALSLISPLTGDLAAGGNKLTGLSLGTASGASLSATGNAGTGVYFSSANTVDVAANAIRAASFATVASGVNYFLFTPSATTNAISLDAEGSDTNIGINFDTKGTGAHIFRRAGGSTEDGRMASGVLLWGTTITSSSAAGDMVLKNTGNIRGVNAAGTDTFRLLSTRNPSNFVVLAPGGNDIVWGRALVALGGGAAPTLGTIGGSGPGTATQNSWMRVIDTSDDTAFWVPVWK